MWTCLYGVSFYFCLTLKYFNRKINNQEGETMANINEYGYEQLRNHIVSAWKYLEIQTPTGTPLKRFDVSTGLVINGSGSTQTIEYKVVAKGADVEFTGVTAGKSVLFDTATGGTAIATETFTDFTFVAEEDELTVIHKLEVPKVI